MAIFVENINYWEPKDQSKLNLSTNKFYGSLIFKLEDGTYFLPPEWHEMSSFEINRDFKIKRLYDYIIDQFPGIETNIDEIFGYLETD